MRAQQRDPVAFSSLITAYERTALAIAYAVLADSAAAGDAVQEACIKAWQNFSNLNDPGRFPAWFARIVRNAALDLHRRRPVRSADVTSLSLTWTLNPTAGLEEVETRQRIDAALAQLDELTRSAVVLRYYDNLSSREIGQILDLSPAAVDTRLNRARHELRQKLTPAVVNKRETP